MSLSRQVSALLLSLALLSAAHARAGQSAGRAARRSGDTASVPQFIQFSGALKSYDGKPATGVAGVTFLLYAEEEGGQSLWRETQNVSLDSEGRYTVALGAATPYGLPADLFAAGQARWLAVEPQGMPVPARILLLSVPYAFKAGDAETLGGLPASAFLRADAKSRAESSSPVAASQSQAQSLSTSTMTGSGTANYLPRWTPDGSTLGNSILFQSGTGSAAKVGINSSTPAATLDVNGGAIVRGGLQLLNRASATAASGASSQPLTFQAAAFSSSTQKATAPKFQWQAEPTANNTAAPGASLNLLYSANSTPAETGLKVAGNGQITFAAGQTFPGAGTITGITAGAGLIGGGTNGAVTLNLNTAFSDSRYAQLGAANTFTAPITFASGQTFPGTVTSVNAGAGLSGDGSGGARTLSLNTAYTDGRYAQLGGNNTFSGVQVMSKLGIGIAPAYPLHVNGTMRAETGLSLGGNATLSVDAPGVANGHFFVNGYGNVGINNIAPQSALDVVGNIHSTGALTSAGVAANSLQINGDNAMTAAPHMYLTGYVQGPMQALTSQVPIVSIPSKAIAVTRMVADGINPCPRSDNLVFDLSTRSADLYHISLTANSDGITDSGPLYIAIPAGTTIVGRVDPPNCGSFGPSTGDIAVTIEYVMQ